VACTGIYQLCAGLERLGFPRVFAVQLLLFYRYLFVIADEASRMVRSLKVRSANWRALPLRVYGSLQGHLLLRAIDRAQRVYRAMVSRGFDGVIRVSRRLRVTTGDMVFLAGWAAFFAAAAWALHPLQVEAAASPGFREDPLASLGLLAMALLYGAWRRERMKGAVALSLAFLSVFLAQLAKENALAAPGLAAALAFADPWPEEGRRKGLWRAWPFVGATVLATALFVAIRFFAMVNERRLAPTLLAPTLSQTILHAPWIFAMHGLAPVVWPFRLRPDRLVDIATAPMTTIVLGWLAVLLLAVAALVLCRRWRRGSIGLLWYGVAWAPTSNLAPLFNPAAERYAYLPDLGLAMLLGLAAGAWAAWMRSAGEEQPAKQRFARDLSTTLAAALLLFLAFLTFAQTQIWKDPRTFWTYALAMEPKSTNARVGLAYLEWNEGRKALGQGDQETAHADLKKAFDLLDEALAINPRDKNAHYNMGNMLAEIGDRDRAEEHLRQVLASYPDDPGANHTMGVICLDRKPPDKKRALDYFRKAQKEGYPENDEAMKKLEKEVAGVETDGTTNEHE
ncbi:MAG: tetratricopeptide repeat protein, partial [Candidatus Sumerlaeota bacterium]|nr:tetratricopeptide repeat protein [Candidatus Sumerlaeota bacterium]